MVCLVHGYQPSGMSRRIQWWQHLALFANVRPNVPGTDAATRASTSACQPGSQIPRDACSTAITTVSLFRGARPETPVRSVGSPLLDDALWRRGWRAAAAQLHRDCSSVLTDSWTNVGRVRAHSALMLVRQQGRRGGSASLCFRFNVDT
ncbi:hypothetical protein ACCO45_005911 [Purpureocillium lilacinum]|uniref:Uncharacterized protein n=1 Tax=Purpureocillium lilacinum TaxID=33203 RepID=A0ACC4DZ29_PURLI